jgi:hypothetical protein
MIAVGVCNQDFSDIEGAFNCRLRELIGSESWIHSGCDPTFAIAQEIAEISIPAEIELHENNAIVGVFVANHYHRPSKAPISQCPPALKRGSGEAAAI